MKEFDGCELSALQPYRLGESGCSVVPINIELKSVEAAKPGIGL
jgi:hypothetical protein